MYTHKLRRLPVVDRDGRLVGILSRADVLSVFTRPDEEIRREIVQDVIDRLRRATPIASSRHIRAR